MATIPQGELLQMLLAGKDADYELGKRDALERLENGTAGIVLKNTAVPQLFGDSWWRGFRDTVKAWQTLHGTTA